MKTSRDPRHQKRIRIMQDLFTIAFQPGKKPANTVTAKIIESLPEIDREIEKAAPAWPTKKINKVDLAILRLAIFEIIMDKGAPYKVVVDEAVELAKEFGTEASPGFVNGALGNVIATHGLDK